MSPERGDRLAEYRAKRDFAATPEPGGDPPGGDPAGSAPRFVVHEHHARRLHWDLRLERAGTLASWAVPKGVPQDPARNHLAVRTEDHPLEYLDFEGDIPAGEYGAGSMRVWDRGTFETHEFREGKVVVTLHGERVRGRYALFRTRGDDWMIHRMDPPEDPTRRPPPGDLRPMLATAAAEPPAGDGWAWELKWDGIRALGTVDGGRLRLVTRTGTDVTDRYPELRPLGNALGSRDALLDGEVVALDEEGRASFQRLQRRMHVQGEHRIRRVAREVPVVYMLFDLLWLDGHPTMHLPYTERRARLAELHLAGDAWRTPPHETGTGEATLAVSRRFGVEGVLAKRVDGVYEPGRRSRAWLKVKHQLRQEFVVGGWHPGQGARAGAIGSLLVGYYEPGDGGARLRYAGRVGTGFTQADLDALAAELGPRRRDGSPFGAGAPPRGSVFVDPVLVVEVRFSEWTAGGGIRQPAFLGVRPDKPPGEVRREEPVRPV